MAKTNREAILKLSQEINKKEGEGMLYSLGSKSANLNLPRWSTNIPDLDSIIGGGMPEGRVVEIYGGESAGKTTLAYHLCGLHDLCLSVPIEGTFSPERARIFGNRPKQMLIYRANYGEDAFNKAIKYAQLGIPLIVFDSVPSMQPREDVEKILKAVDKDAEIETRIGGIARLMTKYLPVLESVIEQTGTTVIFINQIRDKMGMMNPFGDTETTPGGHKLKHACSLRIKVARKQWIEIPNKNPLNTATKEKIGLIMKCKIVKSKVCEPMGECEIPLIFEKGFIEYSDLDTVRKEIMKEHGRKYKEMFG